MKNWGTWVYYMDLPELGHVEATFAVNRNGEIRFETADYEGESLTIDQIRRVEGEGLNDALKAAWEAWHEGPIDEWREMQRQQDVEAAWAWRDAR